MSLSLFFVNTVNADTRCGYYPYPDCEEEEGRNFHIEQYYSESRVEEIVNTYDTLDSGSKVVSAISLVTGNLPLAITSFINSFASPEEYFLRAYYTDRGVEVSYDYFIPEGNSRGEIRNHSISIY